jgi:DNA invertase Pin-like site-specific DNA recombinase
MVKAARATTSSAAQRVSAVPSEALHTAGSAGHASATRVAFSYLRVSSSRQAGDARSGLDRQADQFLPFCQRHGLTPSVDPLVDAGISAYRGSNRQRGALGQFLAAARDGVIPAGSVLVVEDLDRFSREAPSFAEAQLGELFALDLALAVVRDDVVIDRATYDGDIGVRLHLLVRRDAAHDYSRKLGERVSAAHERTRAMERQGQIINGHQRPQWLDFDEQAGAFTVNDRWPIYRRMIDLCLQGYGQVRVAAIINGEGHRNASGGLWSGSAIAQCWRDRRLIGERAYSRGTEIIPGYFPAMLTREEWDRLQAAIAERNINRGRAGRGDHRHNILQGLVYCTCGARRELQTSTKPNGRSYAYLFCKTKTRGRRVDGLCTAKNVPYDEQWLLRAFMGQRWQQYFNRPADNRERRQLEGELIAAETLLAKQRQQQQQAESNVQKLLTSDALSEGDAALLLKLANDARRQGDESEASVNAIRERLRSVAARPSGASAQKAIRERVAAFLAADCADPPERIRFNSWLNTLNLRVVLSNDGHLQMSIEPAIKATYDDAGVTVAGAELVVRVP